MFLELLHELVEIVRAVVGSILIHEAGAEVHGKNGALIGDGHSCHDIVQTDLVLQSRGNGASQHLHARGVMVKVNKHTQGSRKILQRTSRRRASVSNKSEPVIMSLRLFISSDSTRVISVLRSPDLLTSS